MGYYRDYGEPAAHLARCLAEGFAYQGEVSEHRRGEHRGEASAHLSPQSFVSFLQNHDQIGNRALGERIDRLAPPEAVAAALAVLLLAPSPPLLFMGEEWGAESPFLYFCDFGPELAQAVRDGRRREFEEFNPDDLPDPTDPAAFAASKLDWGKAGGERLDLVRRLLALRAGEIMPRLAGMAGNSGESRMLGEGAVACTWRLGDGSRLHLVANLSSIPLPGVVFPMGRVLYSTSGNGVMPGGVMLAWGVSWHLDEGAF